MSRWINIDDLPTSRVEWDDIFDAPSINIVRCKECRYASDNKVYGCMLELFNGNFERLYADDFCSYGERRE